MGKFIGNILFVLVLIHLGIPSSGFAGSKQLRANSPKLSFFHKDDLADDLMLWSRCSHACFSPSTLLAEKSSTLKNGKGNSLGARKRPRVQLNKDYFWGILTDTKYILTSPFRWGVSDWVKTSMVLGATGAFIALDNDIQEFAQNNRSGGSDKLSDVFEPFGNGLYVLPGLAGFYLAGHFFENPKAERVALLSVESFAITGVFTQVLKFATGRPRPNKDKPSTDWNGPEFSGNNSFPSGHSSTVFAVATVIANEYENVSLVPPVAYGVATLTALSRINDNKHWASDVFFGAALGYFVSKTILKLNSNKKGRHYTIYPRISKSEVGMEFAYRY